MAGGPHHVRHSDDRSTRRTSQHARPAPRQVKGAGRCLTPTAARSGWQTRNMNERVNRAKDLTAEAPRGLDAELEGYAWLPRMLDKARATLAGTAGSYRF